MICDTIGSCSSRSGPAFFIVTTRYAPCTAVSRVKACSRLRNHTHCTQISGGGRNRVETNVFMVFGSILLEQHKLHTHAVKKHLWGVLVASGNIYFGVVSSKLADPPQKVIIMAQRHEMHKQRCHVLAMIYMMMIWCFHAPMCAGLDTDQCRSKPLRAMTRGRTRSSGPGTCQTSDDLTFSENVLPIWTCCSAGISAVLVRSWQRHIRRWVFGGCSRVAS